MGSKPRSDTDAWQPHGSQPEDGNETARQAVKCRQKTENVSVSFVVTAFMRSLAEPDESGHHKRRRQNPEKSAETGRTSEKSRKYRCFFRERPLESSKTTW